MTLTAKKLGYEIDGKALLREVSLQIAPGRVHAILGPNGAGKSTLLKLLAAELRPTAGHVRLDERDLVTWDAAALARRRAVLPQGENLRFGFSVAQVVELGRLPCPRHAQLRESDIVDDCLRQTDALHLRERIYPTLSGGERQRVQLARVLAQIYEALPGNAARYLLLDEPTASLDLKHQHDCLHIARALAAQGAGVVAVLHDPNLALQYADEASLLREGRLVATGSVAETLQPELLSSIYDVSLQLIETGERRYLVPA